LAAIIPREAPSRKPGTPGFPRSGRRFTPRPDRRREIGGVTCRNCGTVNDLVGFAPSGRQEFTMNTSFIKPDASHG
jgi:hypothetical protein